MYYVKEGWNTDIDVYEYWIMKQGSKKIIAIVSDRKDAKHIVAALEKQVPKKPREHYNWVDLTEEERQETARWYCKSCDSAVEESYSYCCNCGQKLDWN